MSKATPTTSPSRKAIHSQRFGLVCESADDVDLDKRLKHRRFTKDTAIRLQFDEQPARNDFEAGTIQVPVSVLVNIDLNQFHCTDKGRIMFSEMSQKVFSLIIPGVAENLCHMSRRAVDNFHRDLEAYTLKTSTQTDNTASVEKGS
jgi:hypothetical protein